jgi:UDP-N-acetylmuramyl pentapeptide phosphotransferase/UDP-N-acetylglucosamine-1-phosphate transferase
MIISMQIILGFLIGCIGFSQMANNPLTGSSALLLSGFMIMAGIDGLFAIKKNNEENR